MSYTKANVNGTTKEVKYQVEGKNMDGKEVVARCTETIVPIGSQVMIELMQVISATTVTLLQSKQSSLPDPKLSMMSVCGIGGEVKNVSIGDVIILQQGAQPKPMRTTSKSNPYNIEDISRALGFENKSLRNTEDVIVYTYALVSAYDIAAINLDAFTDEDAELVAKARIVVEGLIEKHGTKGEVIQSGMVTPSGEPFTIINNNIRRK